jgi:hypothetical protein
VSLILSTLDHLVIVAETLEQGVDHCARILGVRPHKGGEHVRTGTHNHLLLLGNETYLEVIAINPAAKTPTYPRWFGMDYPPRRPQADNAPYLATFVARTNDIGMAASALPELGPVRDMQRGDLSWQITIPDNGELIEEGTVPTLIQWQEGVHPTRAMPDSGCHLIRLEVHHPQPQKLQARWDRIGLHTGDRLQINRTANSHAPHLVAYILTPTGLKTIC